MLRQVVADKPPHLDVSRFPYGKRVLASEREKPLAPTPVQQAKFKWLAEKLIETPEARRLRVYEATHEQRGYKDAGQYRIKRGRAQHGYTLDRMLGISRGAATYWRRELRNDYAKLKATIASELKRPKKPRALRATVDSAWDAQLL